MGRPKRVRKESLKMKEKRESMGFLLRSVVNKPPAKGLIRSTKAFAKSRHESKQALAEARSSVAAAVALQGDAGVVAMQWSGPTTSVPLNIKSTVVESRNEIRERKTTTAVPSIKIMDPKEIVKDPGKHLMSSYHVGYPLEDFEKKICKNPKCSFPIRDYVLSVVPDAPTEEGFVSCKTTEMCCSPACREIADGNIKTRMMPNHMYRTGLTLCDDSLMVSGHEKTNLSEYVSNGNWLDVKPHPKPDRDLVMRLVEQYEAAGRPKFEMKKLAPMNSETYFNNMLSKYELKVHREFLGRREDSDDSDKEFD